MSRSVPLLLLPLLLTGCADNSGGPPPDGESVEVFTPLSPDAGGFFCDFFGDAAFLVRDATEAQAFFDDECPGADATAQQQFVEAADGLLEGEVIVIVSVQLGGCLGEWGVHGFYRDEDEVTAWVLRGDSAYGKQNVACTADEGGAIQPYLLEDVSGVTSAAIEVGTYNPDLPGAPAQPG